MLKPTGIVRRLDELGRIVIPVELRKQFNMVEKNPIEVFMSGSYIVLKKYEPNCIFCGATKKLITYNDNLVCQKCIDKLTKRGVVNEEMS